MRNNTKPNYCSNCGHPISPADAECLNCGAKFSKKKGYAKVICIISFVVIIFIVGYLLPQLKPTTPESAPIETALSAEEIYQLASPATVEIRVETEYGTATGTGFFYNSDGAIITNFHVIEDAISGDVFLNNGEKYTINRLIGYDRYWDIAIIQINYQSESVLSFRTEPIRTGETVYALGSSLGLADSFSEGIISANSREIGGQIFIQTTAPISHGNSGGPLIDTKGNVVGITTAGIEAGQNLNLAVPIANIHKVEQSNPVYFAGNLTVREEQILGRLGISYWEWIDDLKVLCDTTDKKIHHGGHFPCVESWRVGKTSLSEPLPEDFQILSLTYALESGYTFCQECNQQ